MVWWWLLLRKRPSGALSLTVSSVVSSSSHLCLVSLSHSEAFRTLILHRLLLYLGTYRGVVPLGVFPLSPKMVADIIAPKLSIIFRGRVRRGSFQECWRSANVTTIPKRAPFPVREDYSPR